MWVVIQETEKTVLSIHGAANVELLTELDNGSLSCQACSVSLSGLLLISLAVSASINVPEVGLSVLRVFSQANLRPSRLCLYCTYIQ